MEHETVVEKLGVGVLINHLFICYMNILRDFFISLKWGPFHVEKVM